jgi:hypothetical protein
MADSEDRSTTGGGTIDAAIPFKLSSIDQRILELNHEGYSYNGISKRLRVEGIYLSKTGVSRHLKELRQDPDNDVKTNNECLHQIPREETREYRVIVRLKKEMAEYKKLQGFDASFRTMFYQLQDEGVLTKSQEGWFNRITVEARLGWVGSDGEPLYPELDIDCFPDDSRKVTGSRDASPPVRGLPSTGPKDPIQYIDYAIERLKSAPSNYRGVGEWGTADQPGGRWYDQPEVVEVWEEKNDLIDGFYKLLEGKSVKVRANHGYSSLDFLNQCIRELTPLLENFEPEDIHIKYGGDWDPPGWHMDYYIQKRLKQLGIEGLDFKRIAVTPEQIKKYNLPLMELKTENGKRPDPHLSEFIRLYGDKATHLNAFFTKKHIKDFKKILIGEVEQHWDQSIYDDMVEGYCGEAEEPRRYPDKELRKIRRSMCNKITSAFSPGWELDGYLDENDDDEE